MCGIFGFLGLGLAAEESRALLLEMERRLQHRGPDERGFHSDAGRGLHLGVRRLTITDPLHGQQPFRTPDGRFVCLFNGEIYNHSELRSHLLARGEPLRTHCDGEVLPFLFARGGAGAFDALDGMYAIAIWDGAEEVLTLAVDPQGEKPLYIARARGGGWLFASELKALLAFAPLAVEVDPHAIRRYLIDKAVFHPRSGLAGVEKLRPGERVVLRAGEPARRSAPDPWRAEEEGRSDRSRIPPESLAEVLRRGVRTTLPGEQPFGFLLSGGLDSSLVLAAAAEWLGPGLPAFTIGYEGCPAGEDERRHAREAASHAGAVLHEVEIGPRDVPALLRRTVWHLDEPNQDPITVPTYAVLGEARRRVRVILTGDGADELFGGYRRLLPLAPGAPPGGLSRYLEGLHLKAPGAADRILSEGFVAGLEADDLDRPVDPGSNGSALHRALGFERRLRLPGYHLSRLDRLSMAWGLEARTPFLRREVRAIAGALGDGDLIRDGEEKVLLRRAARGLVSPRTLERRKQPFTFPLAEWLGGPLLPYAAERLLDPGAWVRGILRPGAVEEDLAKLRQGEAESAPWVWALLVLEEWSDAFLRRRGAP